MPSLTTLGLARTWDLPSLELEFSTMVECDFFLGFAALRGAVSFSRCTSIRQSTQLQQAVNDTTIETIARLVSPLLSSLKMSKDFIPGRMGGPAGGGGRGPGGGEKGDDGGGRGGGCDGNGEYGGAGGSARRERNTPYGSAAALMAFMRGTSEKYAASHASSSPSAHGLSLSR